jgi:hypothetical protein
MEFLSLNTFLSYLIKIYPNVGDYISSLPINAEEKGFEPMIHCCMATFQVAALNHSATPKKTFHLFSKGSDC